MLRTSSRITSTQLDYSSSIIMQMGKSDFIGRFRLWWISLNPPLRWLLAGSIIRFSLAPFTYARDFWFIARAAPLSLITPQSFVDLRYWSYQPPQLFLMVFLYLVWSVLPISHELLLHGVLPSLSRWYIPPPVHDFLINPSLVLTLKLPSILADLLMGLLILQVLQKFGIGRSQAEFGFKLWMLNPVTIWISSVSGHFDAIPTLFTLYALMSMLEGKSRRAGLSLGLGGAWKLWPFTLFPLFLLFERKTAIFRISRLRHLTNFTAFTLLPVGIIAATYQLLPGARYLNLYSPSAVPAGYGLVLGYIIPVQPIGYWLAGIPLTLTILVLFLALVFQSELKATLDISNGLILAQLMLFLSLSPSSSNYMIWLLPFLIIDFTLHRERSWFTLSILTVMISQLVMALDTFGFGFYFASVIPQYVYDATSMLSLNVPVVGTLRAVLTGLSIYYAILRLGPIMLSHFWSKYRAEMNL